MAQDIQEEKEITLIQKEIEKINKERVKIRAEIIEINKRTAEIRKEKQKQQQILGRLVRFFLTERKYSISKVAEIIESTEGGIIKIRDKY